MGKRRFTGRMFTLGTSHPPDKVYNIPIHSLMRRLIYSQLANITVFM